MKSKLILEFRELADKKIEELSKLNVNYKKKADIINKYIISIRKEKLENIVDENINENKMLDNILMIYYVSYIVMLESRNKVWPYEYMAFSRRIGELWEPFAKLPFFYPVREDVEMYEPIAFRNLQKFLTECMNDFVKDLSILEDEKAEILKQYNIVWKIVDSGGIKLNLDLHLKIGDQFYDVDYKSGFSSNEKGNTNRLLLVGSLFNSLDENHNTLIFVRQQEEENNHYLNTLKNSDYWEVFCADKAYEKIHELSGFNLKEWVNKNIDWTNDITDVFKEHLIKNNLLGYLSW